MSILSRVWKSSDTNTQLYTRITTPYGRTFLSSPSEPGRFYPTVWINPAPFRSATCDSYEANADITGVERRTAGHTPGLGCSNLYEMCADHPAPTCSSSPPPSVLLSRPTYTLPAPPRLSFLLFGNKTEFGPGGVSVCGGGEFEPNGLSGGGGIETVSVTQRLRDARDGLCGTTDYVAGITKLASSPACYETIDAKPYRDSNCCRVWHRQLYCR